MKVLFDKRIRADMRDQDNFPTQQYDEAIRRYEIRFGPGSLSDSTNQLSMIKLIVESQTPFSEFEKLLRKEANLKDIVESKLWPFLETRDGEWVEYVGSDARDKYTAAHKYAEYLKREIGDPRTMHNRRHDLILELASTVDFPSAIDLQVLNALRASWFGLPSIQSGDLCFSMSDLQLIEVDASTFREVGINSENVDLQQYTFQEDSRPIGNSGLDKYEFKELRVAIDGHETWSSFRDKVADASGIPKQFIDMICYTKGTNGRNPIYWNIQDITQFQRCSEGQMRVFDRRERLLFMPECVLDFPMDSGDLSCIRAASETPLYRTLQKMHDDYEQKLTQGERCTFDLDLYALNVARFKEDALQSCSRRPDMRAVHCLISKNVDPFERQITRIRKFIDAKKQQEPTAASQIKEKAEAWLEFLSLYPDEVKEDQNLDQNLENIEKFKKAMVNEIRNHDRFVDNTVYKLKKKDEFAQSLKNWKIHLHDLLQLPGSFSDFTKSDTFHDFRCFVRKDWLVIKGRLPGTQRKAIYDTWHVAVIFAHLEQTKAGMSAPNMTRRNAIISLQNHVDNTPRGQLFKKARDELIFKWFIHTHSRDPLCTKWYRLSQDPRFEPKPPFEFPKFEWPKVIADIIIEYAKDPIDNLLKTKGSPLNFSYYQVNPELLTDDRLTPIEVPMTKDDTWATIVRKVSDMLRIPEKYLEFVSKLPNGTHREVKNLTDIHLENNAALWVLDTRDRLFRSFRVRQGALG